MISTGQERAEQEPAAVEFFTVSEMASVCRVSVMTLYRAIQDGEFPAVRIRGRLIVPGQVVRAMAAAAMENGLVDAAEWVVRRESPRQLAPEPPSTLSERSGRHLVRKRTTP